MQEKENDIKTIIDVRKELEEHHKVLHEKMLTVLQKFKNKLDTNLITHYTKKKQELLDMADEDTHLLLYPPHPYLFSYLLSIFPFLIVLQSNP